MARKQRGRPPQAPGRAKGELLQVRLSASERRTFDDAAELSGLTLSAWLRERMRAVARRELEKAGRPVAFLREPADDAPESRGR